MHPRSSINALAVTALAVVALSAGACSAGGGTASGSSSSASTASTASTSTASPSSTAPSGSGPATSTPSAAGCVGTLDGPTTTAYKSVPGVDTDRLSLDVYRRPGASGCPVLIWVHGGGWRTGDKQGRAIDTKVAFAGSLGAVLVSVNYRLVGQDDVMWPAFGEDVAGAVDWVLDHAVDLGIDPSHVVLMGHSSGAHLVSIVATDPALMTGVGRSRSDIRCVVSLDTASYDMREKMADTPALVVPAFGEDPATVADASPTAQVAAHPDGIPDFLIVERGMASRRSMAEDLAAALRTTGAAATLVDGRGYSHEEVNERLGAPGETTITPPTTDFLRSCFSS